jgi:hypothetical protein
MGILFSFGFISFYGGGIDVVGYVYCSKPKTDLDDVSVLMLLGEIFPTHIRPQGVAWSLIGTFLTTMIYIEAAPTALANIKWRCYIIFIVLTLINIIVVYFWCPEVFAAPTSSL